jgi:hypothetical protein
MAALSGITAVRPTANTQITKVTYGETVAVGQPVYLDTTDSEYKLCDSNLSAAAATIRGIAVTPGVDGGYGYIATAGNIILVGTTMAVGETYYVGATAGQINPDADVTTGWYVSSIGTAASTTQLDLNIKATGTVHP